MSESVFLHELMNCEPLSVWQSTGTPNRAKWAFVLSITIVANVSSGEKQLPGMVDSPVHRYLG